MTEEGLPHAPGYRSAASRPWIKSSAAGGSGSECQKTSAFLTLAIVEKGHGGLFPQPARARPTLEKEPQSLVTMSAVIELLAELVAIDSVNPAYGGPGEAGVTRFLQEYFARHRIETSLVPVLPGRDNLVAVLPGRDRSRRLILEAHMDTVSVAGMTIPPFEPHVRDGRLFGRGACDTKGGLAAMVQALVDRAAGQPPPCDVWLTAVVDEEHAYRGVLAVCDQVHAEAAIVAEPTSLRIVTATKGVVRFQIQLRGRAAHSSRPQLGRSAILSAARLVLAVEELHHHLEGRVHPLLGAATGSIGMISGGVQINMVPESCSLAIDRRVLPGETIGDVLGGYQHVIDALASSDPAFEATIEPPLLMDEPLETPPSAALVGVAAAVATAGGLEPDPVGVPYGSDASKLAAHGIPSIVFGPGSIDQAHAAVEYVPVAEVERARDFFGRFIDSFGAVDSVGAA
jgi:acetylornithine deacetylase/succinyl-diaminopimelate desuccinylase family protein